MSLLGRLTLSLLAAGACASGSGVGKVQHVITLMFENVRRVQHL